MRSEEDVVIVSAHYGRQLWVYARGMPARTLGFALAAAVVVGGIGVGYASVKYGQKQLREKRSRR